MRAVFLVAVAVAVASAAACGPANHEGTCKDMLVAGDLVISEVFADYQGAAGGTGADEGKEWIEIYNASARPLELRGLTVVHGKPDGSKQKSHIIDDVTIAPGQYFTMGNTAQDLLPPYIDYGYADDLGDLFNADPGKIQLKCGDAEIDSAIYQDVRPGHSRQLTSAQPPDFTLNDMPEMWCEAAATQFEPGNFGTPGQDNDCAPVIVGQCNDHGSIRDTVGPGPGDLVITEVMPNPAVVPDSAGEWFEVRAMKDIDLNGIGLDRAGDTTATPDVVESPDCIRLATGDVAVFARSLDPLMNGGLAPVGTFRFSLIPGTAASPGDVRILNGSTIVDAVTWTSSRTSRSLSLDPDFTNDTANDETANYCDGTVAYNTNGNATVIDYGSPGAVNAQCPLLPGPGQCLDRGTPRAIFKPTPGQLAITELLPDAAGTGNDGTQEWFEIKNIGTAAFDLNDLNLQGSTATVNKVRSADCKSVAPGAYALFAHGTDPVTNGGLPAVDATFTFSLYQSNGAINILDGTTVIDAITWTTGIQDGASRQLQPALTTPTANDNPTNFCNAQPTQTYGTAGNHGTPKAVNACL